MNVETDTKLCPRCAETVKEAAHVCRYCGYDFAKGEGSSDERGAGVAIAVGAIVAGIGPVLPWMTLAYGPQSLTRSGFSIEQTTAVVVVALAAVMLIIGITKLMQVSMPRFLQRSAFIVALGMGFALLMGFIDLHRRIEAGLATFQRIQINQPVTILKGHYSIYVGPGFWVCVGGLAIVVLTEVSRYFRTGPRVSSPSHVE